MFSFLQNYWWAVLLGGSCLVEIVPIKWNPLSSLFKWIGQKINGPLLDRLGKIEKELDENEKDRIRWEVLDFANSCRNGRRHTRDEFAHILALNDKYEVLLEKTNDTNGFFTMEIEYIKDLYSELQESNGFL